MKKSRKRNSMRASVGFPTSIAAALALASVLGALAAGAARAQAPEPSAPPPVPPRAAPASAAAPAAAAESPGRFYAFAGFAAFAPQKNSGLQNERGSLTNGIFGGGYRISPSLAAELDYLFDYHRLDTPSSTQAQFATGSFQPGTLKSHLSTSGLAATAKFSFAADRLEPYAGGGIGVYSTRFLTTSEAPGCVNNCSDTGPRVSERSTNVGYHALVGADFRVTRKDRFSAEMRYLYLKADFGSILPNKINVGGWFLWMGYRHAF